MDNEKKNEAKILTTNEIRKEARNWSLAGDVGLLAHLEQFSESIINRTQETQKRFTELVDDYEELYTKVGNVTNQFLALQNCQFVENRVYDEETPTEENTEVKTSNEVEQEKLLLMQYKEAVEVGIKLLDTHFQEVQLPPNSDSDDSDDDDDDDDEVSNGNSIIWKAKNPYAEKKFPLLIGSADWWADDHVGLGTEEDILDTEKIVSESESDVESLKSIEKEGIKSTSSSSMENIKSTPAKAPFLDSSSEDLFGLGKNENLRSSVSEDLFFRKNESNTEGTDDFLPDFDEETKTTTETEKNEFSNANRPLPLAENNEEKEEKSPETLRPQKVDNAFTKELMAKLSSVTNKKESGMKEENGNEKEDEKDSEKKIEKKNEIKVRAMRGTEESLFDETDDSSDLFSSKVQGKAEEKEKEKKKRKSVFFESENDDDLFMRENDLFSNRKSFFESEEPKVENSQSAVEDISEVSQQPQKPLNLEKKNSVKDLFDDLDDDDNLFASKPILKSLSSEERNGTLKKTKSDTTTGLVWNSDEALFDNSSNSYNVTVDDDLFSSSSLFGSRGHSADERNKSSLDLFPEEFQKEEKKENSEDFDPKSFLFDSKVSTDGGGRGKEDGDDVFGQSPAKKVSILESEDEDEDLFSKGPRDKKSFVPRGATTFVDDEDAALFGEIGKPSDAVSMSSSRSSLFDDVSASKSRLGSVFLGGGGKGEEWGLGGEGRGAGRGRGTGAGERGSLFGECDEEEEDLFGGDKSGGVMGVEEVRKGVGSVKDFVDELEDDLFKASVAPKLRETKSDIFSKSEKKLFADDEDDSDLFSSTTTVKPKPPTSLHLKGAESEVREKVVGKLNIPDNLKVRFESVAKRISPGGVKVSVDAEGKKKNEVQSEEMEEEKKDDLLDDPPPSSNLLKCPSKDRVKIPGRRRPQSRRARQEALRASGTWDQTSPSPASTPAPASASAPLSNPLSPSTDEEDFFKVPELDTNFEKEDQSIFKNDLFESSKKSTAEDNLLFGAAPVLSPPGPQETFDSPRPSSIFHEDNDDSLFKAPKLLLPKAEGKEKKSLFEDESDEDEDDLFGGKSLVASKEPLQVNQSDNKEREEEKESSTFIDPLGLITND